MDYTKLPTGSDLPSWVRRNKFTANEVVKRSADEEYGNITVAYKHTTKKGELLGYSLRLTDYTTIWNDGPIFRQE